MGGSEGSRRGCHVAVVWVCMQGDAQQMVCPIHSSCHCKSVDLTMVYRLDAQLCIMLIQTHS